MEIQLDLSALSFVDVEYFIRSCPVDRAFAEPSFDVVNKFLITNKDIFCATEIFNTSGIDNSEKDPKMVTTLNLRGIEYKGITKESCEEAFFFSKCLCLSLDECLRIITQIKQKRHSEIPQMQLAKYIFQERNATLKTISLLLDSVGSSELSDEPINFVLKNKLKICESLIGTLNKLLQEVGEDKCIQWKNLNAQERKNLLQLKNTQNLIYVVNILRLLTMLVLNVQLPVGIVKSWFHLLRDTRENVFFMLDPSSLIPNPVSVKIESLITINTLLILGLNSTSSTIDVETPYYKDEECFQEIHKTLEQNHISPVIIYMWSFVLFVKSFTLEEEPERELNFVGKVFGKIPISELTALFASRAEQAGVFEAIIGMSKSLSNDKFSSVIIASFLSFAMHFIPLTVQTSRVIKTVLLSIPEEFVEQFLTSSEFEKKLSILKAKLPMIDDALLPLVNISTAHIHFANFEWKNLQTYTCKQKLGELDYDIVDDDPVSLDMDVIVLKKEAFAHPPLEFDQTVLMPIPEETRGKILPVSGNNEDVIAFIYAYNGWTVLGRMLQNICDYYVGGGIELENTIKDITVALIELVSKVVSPKIPLERSMEIVQYLSTNVADEDVLSLILKIFEHSLHNRNYEVISVCSDFLTSLTPNYQHYVWSHLARSDLLDKYGKTGLATATLGSIELPYGEYSFTLSLIKLTEEVTADSFSMDNEFSSKTKMDMLERLITQLIDISESYQYWKYSDINQRFEIGFRLNSLFSKVLYNVYAIDPLSAPKQKVASILSGCSLKILNAYLTPQSPDVPAVSSLLNALLSIQNIQISLLGDQAFSPIFTQLVKSSFELATLLISIRGQLKMKPSCLERLIYTKSPELVEIYCQFSTLKRHVIRLFHSVVRVPWTDNYLFLLSYLGAKHSDIFLDSISSDLEGPLANHKLSKDLYKFFGALMESKQDGLSILFLTGNIASRSNQDPVDKPRKRKSVLSVLKENALKLDLLPESVGCCLLDSISYAFNTWANARDSKADEKFILALLKRVKDFKPVSASSEEEMMLAAGRYKLISCILEIIALYLFTSTDIDSHIFQLLNQPDLAVLLGPFFNINGYNRHLHESLHQMFEKKWPKLKLSKFCASHLYQLDVFSLDSIFAISLMDQYFGDDEKWIGTKEDRGYRAEVIAASINLKYVNCQIAAAKAWGALLTTFIKKTTKRLNDTFLDLASNFLKLNIESGIEASIFTDVYCERLELCFYILYSFQKKSEPIPEKTLHHILSLLTSVFKSEEVRYIHNVSHSTKRDYYRPILRSVLLVLGSVTTGTHFLELEADQLLEFFEISFCKGVQLIVSEILCDIGSSTSNGKQVVIFNIGERIQDLFLLLSLFTKIRTLNPTANFNIIMASSLNESGTLKAVLNLYSSSHLFNVNSEAILGSLILSFISELCTVDPIATKFINSGLFATLLESPLSIAIQDGGIKLEQQGSLHSIWTNGLLSIILLLLSKFGNKLLPECCLFISYFSKQIETAIYRWSDSKLAVSTALIRETSQLILLQKILQNLNYQKYLSNSGNIISLTDENSEVELVIGLDTEEARKSLNIALKRLLTHPKYLNSRVVATTIEEQRLLDDDAKRGDFVREVSKNIEEMQASLLDD
ncbi:hypothetical protein HG535_0F00460 [Zygotorulaspora mrakii]|uniref:Nucleoporin NUP188 n=1 Tax=Zygotorulaspora mrakii TaxID=42260 RepID=A0A7H9B581_ZYGMR|nr:uncharacterized protein HG535_0F00460 [Zygotorulaspora mrakii]QLG73536.1 hypothetical protein HG535_0F00460 [Zygotorulaspora mrakii]